MLLDGEIWFKTDDDELFEESLEYFPEAGFRIKTISRDLHSEPDLRYFETEHEQMFDAMGKKIKFLIAEPDPNASEEALQELLQYSEKYSERKQ